MSARRTVPLATPVESTDGYISVLTFRPATFAQFCEHGSPFVEVPVEGGTGEYVDRKGVFAWANRLLVDCPDASAVARLTDPRDFAAVEAALRGFFKPPAGPSGPTPTSSSEPASDGLTSIR